MKMSVCLWFFVLIVVVPCAMRQHFKRLHMRDITQSSSSQAEERVKRGTLTLLRTLLASATRVSSLSQTKIYYKHGGMKQAKMDFQSLNPTDVHTTDMLIYLKYIGKQRTHVVKKSEKVPLCLKYFIKGMIMSVSILFGMVAVVAFSCAMCQHIKPLNIRNITETSSSVFEERVKRGTLRLIRTLLASAMRTSAFPSRKVYYKKGGLKQADKDFQSLNPTNVQITDNVKYGKAGKFSVDLIQNTPPAHTKLNIHSLKRNADGTTDYSRHTIVYWD